MAYPGRELLRPMPLTGDSWLAGGFLCATLATSARSLPFRSTQFLPRSIGRSRLPPPRPGSPVDAARLYSRPVNGTVAAERTQEGGHTQTCGFIARRATKRGPPPRQRSRYRRPRNRAAWNIGGGDSCRGLMHGRASGSRSPGSERRKHRSKRRTELRRHPSRGARIPRGRVPRPRGMPGR
jgi:hypothetical protein